MQNAQRPRYYYLIWLHTESTAYLPYPTIRAIMPDMSQQPSVWKHLYHILGAVWSPSNLHPSSTIPWPDVVRLARTNGVAPLIHTIVQSNGIDIPEESKKALAHAYYVTAADNALQFRNLERILADLFSRDVPVLLLKGAALAPLLYENIALRPIGDMDLAIPTQHVTTSRQVLTRLEYMPVHTELAPGASLAYHSEEAYVGSNQTRILIEMHWHLLEVPYYFRKVPMDWFWQNTETREVAGHAVQVLNLEANLIYLPAHLALHHRFHGLRWYMDLALLIHKYQDAIDWPKVLSTAQEFELLLTLQATLDRLADHWPSLPLAEARQRIQALKPSRFEERIFRLLTTEPRRPLLDFYTDIICLPGVPAKARFVLSNLFPQPKYMSKRYGMKRTWALPFWYLYRMGDGLVKMARTLPQVLRLG